MVGVPVAQIDVVDAEGTIRTINVLPTVGQTDRADSLPVTMANDQPAIPVDGSGVTQPVSIVSFNANIQASTAFTPLTSYAAGDCVGGLFTLSTGLNNHTFTVQTVKVVLGGSFSSGSNVNLGVRGFSAEPTSSTFTDGAAAVLDGTDAAAFSIYENSFPQLPPLIANEPVAWVLAENSSIVSDNNGNIYIALVTDGTISITSPYAVLLVCLQQ